MEKIRNPHLEAENLGEIGLREASAELHQIEDFGNGIRHGIRQDDIEMVNGYLAKMMALEIVSQIDQEFLTSDLEILHKFCNGTVDKEWAYEASHSLERTITDFLIKERHLGE